MSSTQAVLHTLLCQFIEPVTFVCCAFIFALRNITLETTYIRPEIKNIYIVKICAIEHTRKLASLAIIMIVLFDMRPPANDVMFSTGI